MSSNRFVSKNVKVYIDAFNMSGFSREIGPLATTYQEAEGTTFADTIIGVLPNMVDINSGDLIANLDTSTDGPHEELVNSDTMRDLLVILGSANPPVLGDPAFHNQPHQSKYTAGVPSGEILPVAIQFQKTSVDSDLLTLYERAWGNLLHPEGAETGVNAGTGYDGLAQSLLGGYMMYHLLSSDGTINLQVEDSVDDAAYNPLAATGLIDASVTPQSGIIPLANNATVERYLRWQLALGTATTATFVISFVRGN